MEGALGSHSADLLHFGIRNDVSCLPAANQHQLLMRIVAYFELTGLAATQIDEIVAEWIAEVMSNRWRRKAHEISGPNFVLRVVALRDPASGQDVDPLMGELGRVINFPEVRRLHHRYE